MGLCVPETCHSPERWKQFHCLENPKQSLAVACVCPCIPQTKGKEFLCREEVNSCGHLEVLLAVSVCICMFC
jgi:hypothetical protein